jgi:hypothetical protein
MDMPNAYNVRRYLVRSLKFLVIAVAFISPRIANSLVSSLAGLKMTHREIRIELQQKHKRRRPPCNLAE